MAFSRAQRRIAFGWFGTMAAAVLVPPWFAAGSAPGRVYAFCGTPPAACGLGELDWWTLHGELFVLAVGMLVHLFVRERADAGRLPPEELERLAGPF